VGHAGRLATGTLQKVIINAITIAIAITITTTPVLLAVFFPFLFQICFASARTYLKTNEKINGGTKKNNLPYRFSFHYLAYGLITDV
jgi:hypothetical protein